MLAKMFKSYFKTDYFPLAATVATAILPFFLAIILGIVPLNLSWLILLVTICLSFTLALSATYSVRKAMRKHKWEEIHFVNACLMIFGYAYFAWSVYRLFRIF